MSAIARHRQAHPLLELKTQLRFCPVSLNLSLMKVEELFLEGQIIKKVLSIKVTPRLVVERHSVHRHST
jgi:hypothetical protein